MLLLDSALSTFQLDYDIAPKSITLDVSRLLETLPELTMPGITPILPDIGIPKPVIRENALPGLLAPADTVCRFLSGRPALPCRSTVYTQVLEPIVCGCLTPSNSPLVRGRTTTSPLTKGGLRGVMQDFKPLSEMCVHRSSREEKAYPACSQARFENY